MEFVGEEGTGLGPSLEFYALVAAELQRKSLGIWLCSDDVPDDNTRAVNIRGRRSREATAPFVLAFLSLSFPILSQDLALKWSVCSSGKKNDCLFREFRQSVSPPLPA